MSKFAPRDLDLPVRRPSFALGPGQLRAHWNGGDVWLSHMFNAGSVLFEVGERFFIDVLREHAQALPQGPLQAQVNGFIGQEANHRRVHVQYNDTLMSLGYDIARLRQNAHAVLEKIRTHDDPLTQLAMVAACEHLTASLASATLSNPTWLRHADEEISHFWRWHCAEEIEHKTVVLDVYHALGGGYGRRLWAFVRVTRLFFNQANRNLAHLFAVDGVRWWRPTQLWRMAVVAFARPGAFWQLVPRWLTFLGPGHDPARTCEQHLIEPVLRHFKPTL